MEEVTEILHEIAESVTSRSNNYYFTISYDSIYELDKDTTRFTHYFDKQIQLESDKYEIGLLGLDTYYSIPNITEGKNSNFRYSVDRQVTWKTISVATGSYEVKTLGDEIITKLGTDATFFTFTPDIATLKCKIKLTDTSAIDFGWPNSFNIVLGFNPAIVSGLGNHYSDNIVNIQPVNSINVNIDCVSGSYINGKPSTSVFGFFPSVSPGYKIIIDRQTPIYLPFTGSSLSSITIWLSDQDGTPVNFRGENVTARFYLRRK